jgi:hypothetical protein
VKAKKAAQTFKEILAEQVKTSLNEDSRDWALTERGLALAQDLLKAEGGDPKVVLAATLLHRVKAAEARKFLEELETEPEIEAAVLELLAGGGEPRDLNYQLFHDVLALLGETTEAPPQFATRTAQRLAAEGENE